MLDESSSDNCTVYLESKKFGSVEYFLEVQGVGSSVELFAYVNVFTTADTIVSSVKILHLLSIVSKVHQYVPLSEIKHKCVYVNVGSAEYVALPYSLCMSLPM